jgi:transcriptional regulator
MTTKPFISPHLPLLLEGNTLIGHMAKANEAWKTLDGRSALFIFHGPHAYISPTFYGTQSNVPTWNYVSVHVRGKVTITEDEAFLKRAILELSRKYDPAFDIEKNIEENKKLFSAITGIRVEISEVFGKFKLAQSKPESERQSVISAIQEKHPGLAAEMKKTLK